MEWTPRIRLIALGIAGLLIVMLAVFVAAAGRDDETAQQEPTPAGGTSGAAPENSTTPGVVSRRWPVDKTAARTVATRFAVPFSNHMPTGPGATRQWLASIQPYADQDFVELASRRFKDYWWYLLSGGLGAEQARVVSIAPVWEKSDAAMYRVVVDRQVRSFLGEPKPRYTERVSWDIKVISPTRDETKVSGCLKTDPRPSTELSDPYTPGEVDG